MKTYYLSFPSWCGAVEIKAVNLKEAKVRAKNMLVLVDSQKVIN